VLLHAPGQQFRGHKEISCRKKVDQPGREKGEKLFVELFRFCRIGNQEQQRPAACSGQAGEKKGPGAAVKAGYRRPAAGGGGKLL